MGADGQDWKEVFSTSVNVVKVNHIPLSIEAKSLRVEMRHTLEPVYGIKSLALFAPRLQAALDDCAAAAATNDARDKYFAVSVNHFEPSAALRAELPALVAAKASLSTALSAVAGAGQKLSSCPGT